MVEAEIHVLVVGGANTDFVVKGGTLPRPGATRQGEKFIAAPGGKGANQAIAAARLGARVAFIGRVGADPRGDEILAALDAEGVDVHVARDPDECTGVALVMIDRGGEKQIQTAPGANFAVTPSTVTDAGELFARARVVLVCLECPLPVAEAAVRIGRAAGCRVVLDPAPPRALPEEMLRDVHVIRPNAIEAEVLTGVRVVDPRSARQAADNLLRRGVGAAVVGTPGGNLMVAPGEEVWVPHVQVEVVDTTGAGDAFAAALSVALAEGDALAHATRFAGVAAALKSQKLGAQAGMPRRADVDGVLRELEKLRLDRRFDGNGAARRAG